MLITLKISLWTTLLAVAGGYPVAYLISSLREGPQGEVAVLGAAVVLDELPGSRLRVDRDAGPQWRREPAAHGRAACRTTPSNLLYSLGAVLVGMVHALHAAGGPDDALRDGEHRPQPSTRRRDAGRQARTPRSGASISRCRCPASPRARIMVFVTAVGFFIVPQLLGGRREMMITQLIIEQVLQTLNWGFAGSISVLMLVVVVAVFALYDKVLGLSTMTGESSQRTAGGARRHASRRRCGARGARAPHRCAPRPLAARPHARARSRALHRPARRGAARAVLPLSACAAHDPALVREVGPGLAAARFHAPVLPIDARVAALDAGGRCARSSSASVQQCSRC